MATFFLDFENGNDVNDGTTFANRWKTLTNGATSARIAPGDTIRMMGSPAPTSLGQNGVWTSQQLQSTKLINGATNATPISITCVNHGYLTGDTVVITGVGGTTSANGTWEITSTGSNTFTLDGSTGNGTYTGSGTVRLRNNTRVILTSAVSQNIASTGARRSAWTAVAGGNVTTSFNTSDYKEHNQSDSIAIGAGFTTGLAAYWTLPASLNLSGYQQVSFWIKQTAGTIGSSGAVDLRLCSDNAGVTAVNTINIPNLAALNRWMPVTVDLGANLGSSIASIALYVNTDNGAQTFLLNNIIACKASSAGDSLTLTSLIGKNKTNETYWGIQSINGRRVMLDADTSALPTSANVRGYYGTSETVTTWKRETIKLGPAGSTAAALQTIQNSGTDGNPITFSGGWDRTNMSTQNLETWLDGQNGAGYAIANDRQFITIDNIAGVRFNNVINSGSTSIIAGTWNLVATNNNLTGIAPTISRISATIKHACANITAYNLSSTVIGWHNINIEKAYSNSTALNMPVTNGSVFTTTARNNAIAISISAGGGAGLLLNCDTADNDTAISHSVGLNLYLKNCLIAEVTELSLTGISAYVFSHDHDQTPGNHKIFANGGLISAAIDQRKTASGISWKLQPTNASIRTASHPLILSLAKVAFAANSLVTVKAWMRRDNTGLTMRLVCKGGQIAGVANDVAASVTTINAWEEEVITFTPTEAGVVEITAEAWGGTTFSGWVDDMTISQA